MLKSMNKSPLLLGLVQGQELHPEPVRKQGHSSPLIISSLERFVKFM